MPGLTVLAVAHFFRVGQSRTSLASPFLMFTATAPPRDEPTTTSGDQDPSAAVVTALFGLLLVFNQLHPPLLPAFDGQAHGNDQKAVLHHGFGVVRHALRVDRFCRGVLGGWSRSRRTG
jgi:hypothetical protein